MNKGIILKKINELTPGFIKNIFARQIRNKVIKNKIFIETIEEINKFDRLSENEKEEITFNKLKKILIYSYENTKYYKDIFDEYNFNPYEFKDNEELTRIPTIDKNIILENFDDIISKEDIDFYLAYTGGSTGKPLKILLDTDSIYKEKGFVYNYWSKFGYDYKTSRTLTLRGLEFGEKYYIYNPIDNQIVINPFKLNDKNILEYIKIINKFKPEFIHGYASAIFNLSKIMNKNKLKLDNRIKGICFVSENVEEFQKKYIEETFSCKSNIFYGHSERAVFAEYIDDSYNFNNLYTHVDLEETDEENVYSIICTGLINKKMPLIRYKLDDKVIVKEGKINIYGHWDKELLLGKNNEKISMASINFHNDIFNKIRRYQFVQDKVGKVKLNIVQDQELTQNDKNDIINILNKKLKGILDIEIDIVNDIKLTKRGKHKKIIQNIKC